MLAKLLSGDWGFYIWVIENGHPKTEANGALGFGDPPPPPTPIAIYLGATAARQSKPSAEPQPSQHFDVYIREVMMRGD